MSYTHNKTQIFAERDADDFLSQVRDSIRLAVDRESDDYLLNVNEESYLDHIVDQLRRSWAA